MSLNLLVTGGAGFIGSHFVLRHKEQYPSDTVVVLDKLTYAGRREHLAPVMDRIRFIEGDIVDVDLVQRLCERYAVSTIVNFAAESHVDRSIENSVPFIHTNILGVQSLIEACKTTAVRLFHISTDEVFGDIADGDPPRRTEDALAPSSPYAASKAAGEMLILAAMRTHGVRAAIARCTNNYGPHQATEKFIPTVIRTALGDRPVPIYGEGENKRDWLYVTDHCDALEAILRTEWAFADELTLPGGGKQRGGHIFHISADDERRNIDVAKMILSFLGKPESLLSSVEDRPGHDWRYALDSSSVRRLGWRPKVPFEEGLRRTIGWYRESLRV